MIDDGKEGAISGKVIPRYFLEFFLARFADSLPVFYIPLATMKDNTRRFLTRLQCLSQPRD